jgi:ribosomal protein S11
MTPKSRLLYHKVFIRQQWRETLSFDFNEEFILFETLKKDIRKYINRTRWWRPHLSTTSLGDRTFNMGRVFVKQTKRNFFITISNQQRFAGDIHVLRCFSCGKIGFLGPKRGTLFAKQNLIKTVGQFIAEVEISTLDFIFASNMKKLYRLLLRNLYDLVYFRNLIIKTRRSFGISRLKKKRRV